MSDLSGASPSGLSVGRAALLAATACYGLLVIYQAMTLPERVPAQIGPFGEVGRWGDRASHLATTSVAGVGLFLIMWFLPRLIARLPKDVVNLPHKDYWLRPENLPRAQRILADDVAWVGAATMALIGVAAWEAGRIAQGASGSEWTFWVVFVVYMVGVVGGSIWSLAGRRWRPPTS